jgi:hypothetical protein
MWFLRVLALIGAVMAFTHRPRAEAVVAGRPARRGRAPAAWRGIH